MRLKKIVIFFASCQCLAGVCKPLNFESLQTVIPGKVLEANIRELLGNPDNIIQPNKTSETTWKYLENGTDRLDVFTEPGGKVVGWSWHVHNRDPENNLKTALKKFPGSHWIPDTEKWINPHWSPTECFFKDNEKGITVTYATFKKEVKLISRWNPSRSLTEAADEKPPAYCIDKVCTPGISAKDYFKDGKFPCKLP